MWIGPKREGVTGPGGRSSTMSTICAGKVKVKVLVFKHASSCRKRKIQSLFNMYTVKTRASNMRRNLDDKKQLLVEHKVKGLHYRVMGSRINYSIANRASTNNNRVQSILHFIRL